MPIDAGLVGRNAELETLNGLIGGLPDSGGALLITGEAGIGRSSLLRTAVERAGAAGHRVLEATGTQAESALPYAGLHQLLWPVIRTARPLPEPQRQALLSAMGLGGGPPPETFTVGLGLLTLLAEGRPVVVALDDLHWLDRETQEVLAFVAHRVDRDPILIIATVRAGHASPLTTAGLAELPLHGLDEAAARELLLTYAADLGAGAQDRVLREAGGNPLALLELADSCRSQAGPGPDRATPPPPLTARLERAFAGRIAGLPPSTRDAVLVAAIDYGGELPEILTAAAALARLPLTTAVFDPAVQARLLRLDGARLRFHHPLVRSAVLGLEPLARHLAAHAAMAQALSAAPGPHGSGVPGPYGPGSSRPHGPGDAHRRAWHRAQSILGPDDEVADELEAGHTTSLRRGQVTAAIWALERAAQLTTDPAARGRRSLLAAGHAFTLGRPELVERLVTEAARHELTERDRARLEWLKEIFTDGTPGDVDRVAELCTAAAHAAHVNDPDLALDLLHGAALRCWWADPGRQAAAQVAVTARSLPARRAGAGRGGWREARRLAAMALAEPVRCGAAVHDLLDVALPAGALDSVALCLLGQAAHAIGELPRAADLLSRSERLLRDEGRLGLLAQVLTAQVTALVHAGDWDRAGTAAEEARRLATDTGQPLWATASTAETALWCALRGDTGRALELADVAGAAAAREGLGDLLCRARLAKGVARLVSGRYEQAYEELRRPYDPEDPSHHPRESFGGVLFFAEAALNSGHQADARRVLAGLERTAFVTPAPLLHTQLLYARAVLAPGPAAESLYDAALARDLSRWPLVRGKLELAYGGWLRRHRRTAEARMPLRAAQTTFDLMGATAWADQAREDLRAAGERAPRARPATLSPQELQIARLAAGGLSNKEIGERLHLSPRTIGSHLYRIFPKLGITARAQLASRLERLAADHPPGPRSAP